MTYKEHPLHVLALGYKRVIGYAVLGALAGFALSFLSPLEYSSSVRLLITQPNAVNVDSFTVLKSNERIAQNLAQLLGTSSFFDNIVGQAENYDRSAIPQNEYDKRKFWNRSVSVGVEAGSGLMTVTVYAPQVSQARSLVWAASNEIAKQAPNYFGSTVRVSVIDAPLDSRWYARPNIPMNAAYGAVVGGMLTIAWLLLRRTKREA
jgi:capsular polysaccharide biosynthesis protein